MASAGVSAAGFGAAVVGNAIAATTASRPYYYGYRRCGFDAFGRSIGSVNTCY
jgi:hypothetical protein